MGLQYTEAGQGKYRIYRRDKELYLIEQIGETFRIFKRFRSKRRRPRILPLSENE